MIDIFGIIIILMKLANTYSYIILYLLLFCKRYKLCLTNFATR